MGAALAALPFLSSPLTGQQPSLTLPRPCLGCRLCISRREPLLWPESFNPWGDTDLRSPQSGDAWLALASDWPCISTSKARTQGRQLYKCQDSHMIVEETEAHSAGDYMVVTEEVL